MSERRKWILWRKYSSSKNTKACFFPPWFLLKLTAFGSLKYYYEIVHPHTATPSKHRIHREMQKYCKTRIPTSDCALMNSILHLFQCLADVWKVLTCVAGRFHSKISGHITRLVEGFCINEAHCSVWKIVVRSSLILTVHPYTWNSFLVRYCPFLLISSSLFSWTIPSQCIIQISI